MNLRALATPISYEKPKRRGRSVTPKAKRQVPEACPEPAEERILKALRLTEMTVSTLQRVLCLAEMTVRLWLTRLERNGLVVFELGEKGLVYRLTRRLSP